MIVLRCGRVAAAPGRLLMSTGLSRPARMQPYAPAVTYACDVSCVEVADEEPWSEVDLSQRMRELGLQVRQGFASAAEQAAVVAELEGGPLKKLKYEKGHWDSVIAQYRETERQLWNDPLAAQVVARMKALFPPAWSWRPQHVLDLKAEGEIGPHIDAVATVGDVVCGLSLMSTCVMTFASEEETFRVLLRPGSLYVMAGESRHRFTHAIAHKDQTFGGTPVIRARRISVMLRDYAEGTDFSHAYKMA